MIVTFFTLSILIIDHLRDYGFKRDADNGDNGDGPALGHQAVL